MQSHVLEIDGSHGEGGGQILRTALCLAAVTGRAIRFRNIRAKRRVPGLAAQHLTSVRAVAAICAAEVDGDALGSKDLQFEPKDFVRAGSYHFDVAEAREGGSAGGASLVLQTVLLPLSFAEGRSEIIVEGGTHNPMSPPFDYLRDVWLATVAPMGIEAEITLEAWGWFPVGQGRIQAALDGHGGQIKLKAINRLERGQLLAIRGRAVAANLPSHIPARMMNRAHSLVSKLECSIDIQAERVRAACPGAGIFLNAVYEHSVSGFSAIGERGRSSEDVAEEAALALIAFHSSSAALDAHMGDQVMLPAALADGPSQYTVHRVTRHLRTNAWVIEQFGLAQIDVIEREDGTGHVTVTPSSG